MNYELIIIGGGPAGVSAGVYAARKRLKTLLITESFGGQSVESMGVENWIGTQKITGPDLGKALETHVRSYTDAPDATIEIKEERVQNISKDGDNFIVKTNSSEYATKTVLIATGSSRRKLDIPGAKEFENKGITYCASCDGPIFAGQDVVVIGGGNAGFESAAQLLAYCKSVTLLNRGSAYKADELTVQNVLKDPKMKGILNAMPKEIKGDIFVSSIVYTDTTTNTDHEIPATGIFVEVGLIPATSFAEGLLELNAHKQIPVDPQTQRTGVPGVWAAGDATDGLFHQNNIASGDAVKALEDIYLYLKMNK
jgi:alkyl hydroperoxide reductase subunit AhpF